MARNFRTGAGFARPENALKRADELENVGQKQSALQALHDIITSKKHRTWSKTYESIMFKHIDLCVEMKKRNHAKEALMQYRNMCQQVNINSLEEVIKYFLNTASSKAEEAQQKADAVITDIEDLEQDASPEDLMLSYVSGEKSKDRTDRELVTPWFKFLWETYRSVLEILRTNPKLEGLYAMTANRAFQFCLQYKRTAEFRRLCDILRQHYQNMTKYRDQREAQQPESQLLHLETRFEQLRVACDLELWAEAFRTVGDIQDLMHVSKKQPKTQQMAMYYAKLTQIFAMSESRMYSAYAWLKLLSFSKAYNKNLAASDLQMMASCVLLGTLSILPYDRVDTKPDVKAEDAAAEHERERIARMAQILGFSVDLKRDQRSLLSRAALMGSISNLNILGLVPAEVKAIYELLTAEYSPLELCNRLKPLLEKLEALTQPMSSASPVKDVSLALYAAPLKQAAVLRLLKQLSDVYSTMHISALGAMVPFISFAEVESIIVDAVKYEYLELRIDHCNGTLHFGSQVLEAERVRNQLSTLSRRLTRFHTMTTPKASEDHEARKEAAVAAALEEMSKDHSRAMARKILIEKRKEEAEAALLEAEREEERRKREQAREAEIQEERRRQQEVARREKERIERELEERELEEARAMLEASRAKKGGAKVKGDEKMDKASLMSAALSEKLKEQQELERKLQRLAKLMDHMERAKREEETPYLKEAWAKRVEEEKSYFEVGQTQFVEQHRQAWDVDIIEKRRMAGMMEDKATFQAQIVARRQEEFAALRVAREARAAERRAQRKAEREELRREAFVHRCLEECDARVAELREQKKKEDEERRRVERAERQKQLDEAAAKQRAREEEIERKLREEKDAIIRGGPRPAAAAAPPPAAAVAAAAPPAAAAPAPAPAAAAAAGAPAAAAAAGGFEKGKYVPLHLRKKMEASAPEPSSREPPRGSDDRAGWGGSRDAPRDAPRDADWGGRPAAPRDEPPPRDGPPPREGERWAGERRGDAAPPAAGGRPAPFAAGPRREERRPDERGAPPPSRPPATGGSRW